MPFVNIHRPCAQCCDIYKCPHCPEKKFETAGALILHLKRSFEHKCQEKDGTFRCFKCEIDFLSRRGFIHHLQQKRIHKYDLHQAACCGRFQDVARLIQNENADETGASHIVKSSGDLLYHRGMTPMHCAAFRGYARCLRVMLSWEDGNPNSVDEIGQTPVHVAAKCGKASSLRLLLKKGGRLDLEDRDGITPIKLATDECIATIIRHQITTNIGREISKLLFLKIKEAVQSVKQNIADIHEIEEDGSCPKDRNSFPSGDNDEGISTPSCTSESASEDGEKDVGCSSALVERSLNTIGKKEDALHVSIVSSHLFPYEVIARGEKAIEAFKSALTEGTSSASRLKIIVVGNVSAGKTSLVRSLSGQPFLETREKTHGIQTTSIVESIVENTELNVLSWKLADNNESHLDKLIAKVVSDTLKLKSEIPRRQIPELPPSPGEFDENQIMKAMASTSESLPIPTRQMSSSEVLITSPSIPVEGSPRNLPASLIAENLLRDKNETENLKVNIWDFAGHQLYEPMHHLFMNSRSLYIVVFDLCKMSKSRQKCLCAIHYWLNSIASHTNASTPIILVGTHKAQVSPDFIKEASSICEKHFVSTFGQRLIRGFNSEILFAVENSLSEDEGITNLRNVIKTDASTNFPFVNEQLPLQWLHCEEEIINYRQNPESKMCMTLVDFKIMLEERCMVKFTDDDFHSMILFFHDTGLVLLPANMCGVEEGCVAKDFLILSPQYLVDIMTSIHDVPKDRHFQRKFSDEFRKLELEGRIDRHVLEYVWKNKDVNVEILVELLSCFKILYPLEAKEGEKQMEYIIPCMLKNSSDRCEKRWQKACEGWNDETSTEHQFVFDFGRYLPPALFHYLLVDIYRHNCQTKGIKPIIKRHSAIFSFSSQFLFRLKLVLKDCQIWIYSRCKKEENFLDLAKILMEKVSEICKQYFKYLKFVFGPRCPYKDCPGATFHVESVQRPCESSSEEDENSQSSDDAGLGTKDDIKEKAVGTTSASQTDRRCHVIPMKLDSFDPPYWCREVDVSHDLKNWDPTLTTQVEDVIQCSEEEIVNAPALTEEFVRDCCLSCVAPSLGKDWKEVGRKLDVTEPEMENISSDWDQQREHGYQVILKWKNRHGNKALVRELINALELVQLSNVADELRKHIQNSH